MSCFGDDLFDFVEDDTSKVEAIPDINENKDDEEDLRFVGYKYLPYDANL